MENKTDKQKQLELLRANNLMLERTRKESAERGKGDAIELIDNLQKEVKEQLTKEGIKYEIEDNSNDNVEIKETKGNKVDNTLDVSKIRDSKYKVKSKTVTETVGVAPKNITHNYDTIPLVSKGQCYPHKKSMIPVGYLTAADENLIIEPNMYVNGLIFDVLLRNKILDEGINPDYLIKADRDQVILWLRMTGYGPEFPVKAIDPETKQEFEAIADLSKIKPNPFLLVGDENGWFEFKLPQSGDIVKFTYPNRLEEKEFEKVLIESNKNIQRNKLKNVVDELKEINSDDNDLIEGGDKTYLKNVIFELERLHNDIGQDTPTTYPKIVTERLKMHIKEINGKSNPRDIEIYINNMLTRDSLALRNYMDEHEPSLNFEIELERPESLGGGSIKTFLEIGPTLFFNIA